MRIIGFKLLCTCISAVMFAKTSYSLESSNYIEEGAKLFLIKEIRQKHKTVDPESIEIKILNSDTINNKFCKKNIYYYFPIYSNINKKATIIAECKDQNSWKVYIPVRIKFLANVVSAKRSLPKLHIINKEDLIQKKVNVINLKSPYFDDSNEVVGLILQNSIKQDTALTSNLLKKVEHGA